MLKCILFLFISISLFAQSQNERLNGTHLPFTNTKDANIHAVKYLNNSVRYFTTNNYNRQTDFTYPDSTIIDFNAIDTTLFNKKYSYWNYVPLGDAPGPLVAGDINKNGHGLIFGDKFRTGMINSTVVCAYQLNNADKFDSVFSFDSTIFARSIYDINGDGKDELYVVGHYILPIDTVLGMQVKRDLIFSETGNQSIPKTLSFIFDPYRTNNSQQDCNTWGKFDNDQYPSEVFVNPSLAHTRIYKYNPFRNNLDSVYECFYGDQDIYFQGFAVGDFENNGKTEIVMGSIHGQVLMIRNIGLGTYETISLGNVETYNAYLCFTTNDLDGNGKKEIWVGGDAYFNGIPITRMTCFEYDSNDSYKIVGKIDVVGAFSLDAFNAFSEDVDNDGKDELVLDLGNTVMILKFAGSPNHQKYELFYAKHNEIPNSTYLGASMADLNGDGKKELLIAFQSFQNTGDIFFSHIYKPAFLNGIKDYKPTSPNSFQLYQNYPNPFNPETTIKFKISERTKIQIKIYNSLGKEIEILKDNEYSPGEYNINWDARDNNGKLLPSGVYFIQFISDKFNKTIKSILLK
jgi:hypothetical protein